jgi:peptide/nickel transport system ATP-binding protein
MVMYAGQMVEGGASETVTQRPAHPYTQLLIESAPDPDRITGVGTSGALADSEGGEPPSLLDPPSGCRFHPRCPHVMARCEEELPPRLEVGDESGHWASCWLFDQSTVRAAAVTR